MIKTVELTGSEIKVEGLDGKNTAIYNKSSAAVYASCSPDITPNADGVMEVPAGGYRGLSDTCGIVYLLGAGKVELTGTDDSVNFKMPSSSTSGGGGEEKSEKGAYCGITEFVSDTVGIKSTTIEYSSNFPSRLAEILAEETGWELQADGVTVLKNGAVGVKFTTKYVYLANNLGAPNDSNFQYIMPTYQNGVSIDICTSTEGTVAFGCRGKKSDKTDAEMNLPFIITKNANGDDLVLALFMDTKLYRLSKGKSNADIFGVAQPSIANAANSAAVALCPDETGTCLFKDIFLLTSYPSGTMLGDSVFNINGKEFRLLKSTVYTNYSTGHTNPPLLALPI